MLLFDPCDPSHFMFPSPSTRNPTPRDTLGRTSIDVDRPLACCLRSVVRVPPSAFIGISSLIEWAFSSTQRTPNKTKAHAKNASAAHFVASLPSCCRCCSRRRTTQACVGTACPKSFRFGVARGPFCSGSLVDAPRFTPLPCRDGGRHVRMVVPPCCAVAPGSALELLVDSGGFGPTASFGRRRRLPAGS